MQPSSADTAKSDDDMGKSNSISQTITCNAGNKIGVCITLFSDSLSMFDTLKQFNMSRFNECLHQHMLSYLLDIPFVLARQMAVLPQ
jgi:hypothetical protein